MGRRPSADSGGPDHRCSREPALASPLAPDDYLGLIDPLLSARHPAGRVVAVRPECAGAATLEIRPGRGWAGHRAGQYLPVGVEIDGVRHWRTYSITSPPEVPGRALTITVKEQPGGRVSPHLVHRTRPGTVLRLGPAQGEFTLPEDPLPPRMLMVTAGSGITPVAGMLRTLAGRRLPGPAPLTHRQPEPPDRAPRLPRPAQQPLRRTRATGTRDLRPARDHVRERAAVAPVRVHVGPRPAARGAGRVPAPPGLVRIAAVTWTVGWLTLTCSRPEGRLRRVCAGVVGTAASTGVPLRRDST